MSLEKVPLELKSIPNWVCWKIVEREGKKTKIPINPRTLEFASCDEENSWGTFEEVEKACQQNPTLNGVGFVFTKSVGIVGVDLDKCRNPETGQIEEWATKIICAIDSYTEISPSLTGVHILLQGQIPGERRRKDRFEIYEDGRYFTVTGNVLDGIVPEINLKAQERLNEIYLEIFKESEAPHSASERKVTPPSDILERMLRSKSGEMIRRLYSGEWEGRYKSQSEADQALMFHFAFWTNKDASEMDRLFRSSGLFREKYEREDYCKSLIQNALDAVKVGYAQELPKTQEAAVVFERTEIERSQIGDARAFAAKVYRDARYLKPANQWIFYSEGIWIEDEKGTIVTRAMDHCESLYGNASALALDRRTEDANLELKHARSGSRLNYIDGFMTLASAVPGMTVLESEMDLEPWFFNCANGVIDLKSGKLLNHSAEYYMRRKSPIAYIPGIRSEAWESFLNDIFCGDQNLLSYVKRAGGYSLTGDMREQCWFFLHGSGDNGKSTFLDILNYVMGDYAAHADATIFEKHHSDAIRQDLAKLPGIRLVRIPESKGRNRVDSEKLKEWTGQDPITCRRMRENEFTFKPSGKIWMYGNNKPLLEESDEGSWRRPRLIPFLFKVDPEKKNKQLGELLRKEASAILNWMVEGCLEWQAVGMCEPESVLMATSEYQQEMDPLQAWVTLKCEVASNYSETSKMLYKSFCLFEEEIGNDPPRFSSGEFGHAMSAKGHPKHRSRPERRVGIRLKSTTKDQLDSSHNSGVYN